MALLTLALVLMGACRTEAFSLLGPYSDWMEPRIGYHQAGDIGGPMDLNEEYRWNVPVVTYAFDQKFLDYFGSNGVAAVEQAIQVLNDLPPASNMVLSNFPFESLRYRAAAQGLYDLRSVTLSLLLQHMGLADAVRNIHELRRWDPLLLVYLDSNNWYKAGVTDVILKRNFDPETFAGSVYVNSAPYFSWYAALYGRFGPEQVEIVELSPDSPGRYLPLSFAGSYNLGVSLSYGEYFQGLTRDDAGGIRYLLSTNNVNLETLLPGVHGVGVDPNSRVDLALRPGVDKITFLRQDYDSASGQASPITNRFTDVYLTNGVIMRQDLERIISQPDFLFSVAEVNEGEDAVRVVHTGASGWWNSASLSGSGEAGPGVIQPPVRIAFKRTLARWTTNESFSDDPRDFYPVHWGSFDNSSNAPIVYPCGGEQPVKETVVRFRCYLDTFLTTKVADCCWRVSLKDNREVSLQISTNLADWTSITVITNSPAVEWSDKLLNRPQRFFRAIAR